ncbi:MAG: hypothetical protein WCP16_15965 [Pseudanabaena sp. ELA645]|jgi:hypothetical protein
MNLPTIFNIAIGLIFIYLVLSLLASQIQEVIATILEWRAEQLTRGIENLVLGDTDPDSKIKKENEKSIDLVDKLFKNPLIQNLNQTSKSWTATIPKKFISWLEKTIPRTKKIISWLAKIPIIQKFIPQDQQDRNTINPTYLPAETFSSTILSVIDIPKAARVLTWLNAKRLIHYEIYNKIDKLLVGREINQYQKDVIKKPYEELKKCLVSVLDDYKMERYGLSSTLIRLRTQIETFKRETEECFATKESSQSPPNLLTQANQANELPAQTIKPIKNPIDKIIDFIFTPDKNNSDLVSRLRPSLTTILDLLIPPPKETFEPVSQAIDFIFTPDKIDSDLEVRFRSRLSNFLKLLMPANTSKIKSREDRTVNQFDQVIDFIFQNKYELDKSHRENFSKILDCLISPETCKNEKLKDYQIFKVVLEKTSAKSKNADDLYKLFIEIEEYYILLPYQGFPLACQSFQLDLRKSEEKAKSKDPEVVDLYESFTYAQDRFSEISNCLPESLRKSLYELALRSRIKASDIENQLDHFKKEIETWFDRSMERSSGVYKRNARGFAFLIGFVLAVTLNADTFYIISRLSKDDALRNSIVSTSTELVQNVESTNPNVIERVKDNVDQSLSEITLPIGWNDNILEEQLQIPTPIKENETLEEKQKREKEKERRKAKFFGRSVHPVVIMIMGWLVTATAIMMGAPFWFDFLGLFINVRNTGSRPVSKTDNK